MTKVNPSKRISSAGILTSKNLKQWEENLSSITNNTHKYIKKVLTENNNKILRYDKGNKNCNICEKTSDTSREKIFYKESDIIENTLIDN